MPNDKEDLLRDIKKMLAQVNETTSKAPVLNGGFDRLMERVSANGVKISEVNGSFDRLMERVSANGAKISEIKTALFDPDRGLYVRVRDMEYKQEQHGEQVTDYRQDCDHRNDVYAPILAADPERQAWRATTTQHTQENHDAIEELGDQIQAEAASRLERDTATTTEMTELRHKIEILDGYRSNANRIVWALVMLTVISWAKTIMEMM